MARARRYEIHINERYHDYWGDDIFEVDEPIFEGGKIYLWRTCNK